MPPSAPPRLVSVDVLRGLTIALMILVNDPGDWAHVYPQLDHSVWNGFTLTDFVFPNFLFLVGVSVILSMRARIARAGGMLTSATRRSLALHALRRAATLVLIRLFLAAYPHFHLTQLRLFGVLTRIAACYLAAALLCLWTTRARSLALITAALLVGYWALMRFVPVPGLGLANWRDAIPTHVIPILDPDRNLAATLDRAFNAFTQRWLHTGSLYNLTRDPEGILSTLPAIATTLIGCLAGLAITPSRKDARPDQVVLAAPDAAIAPSRTDARPGPAVLAVAGAAIAPESSKPRRNAVLPLAASGLALSLAGLAWNPTFPINKNLWTSSYALFAGGLSLILLALFHWLYELRRANQNPIGRALTLPWLIFGANAITAFIVSELLVETLIAIPISNPADPIHPLTAWTWPYWRLFALHGSTPNTSVAFAIVFTLLCLLPNWILWHRRIFLRV